jgi:hypothetical protein
MKRFALGLTGLTLVAGSASAAPKAQGTPQRDPTPPPGFLHNQAILHAALHCLGSNGRPCQAPASP